MERDISNSMSSDGRTQISDLSGRLETYFVISVVLKIWSLTPLGNLFGNVNLWAPCQTYSIENSVDEAQLPVFQPVLFQVT